MMDKSVVRLPMVHQLVSEYGDELLLAFVLRADADNVWRKVVSPATGFSVDSKTDGRQLAFEDFAVEAAEPVLAQSQSGNERSRCGTGHEWLDPRRDDCAE